MSIIQTKKVNGGFILEVMPSGFILSITDSSGNTIKVNDFVISSGRFMVPKGVKGRVIEIREPYKDSTTDVIRCEFNGIDYYMKTKDLLFQHGSYVVQ